jgi:CRISPR-associated RAMP protein (TIGR02581 family)
MITFDRLENRYIFTGQLVLREALHIGSGESNENADSPFVRSGDKCYIPGSSLRGALRSTVERIANSLGKNSCLLFDSGSAECISVDETMQQAYQDLDDDTPERARLAFLNGKICDTCKVFGSPYFASKLKLSDLYPSDDADPQANVRYGIAIDRDTGTTVKGALFEIEAVEKGGGFDFELIAENLDDDDFGLLCIGLCEMIWGEFYIGANSASGLGKCRLAEDLKIKYFQKDDTYDLKRYIARKEYGEKIGVDALRFIAKKMDDYLNREE